MKLEKNVIGTIHFNGVVDATDPCYDDDVWCRVNGIEIEKGTYTCISWEDIETGRPFICGIYLDDIPEWDEFSEIGEAGVDAGLCGFFENKPNYTDEMWREFCNKLDIMKNKAWIMDNGFFTNSGWGDGCYCVFGYKRENDDKFSALEIRY